MKKMNLVFKTFFAVALLLSASFALAAPEIRSEDDVNISKDQAEADATGAAECPSGCFPTLTSDDRNENTNESVAELARAAMPSEGNETKPAGARGKSK